MKKIYVLEYVHKHGNDLSAFECEEDAQAARFQIMLAWITDLEGNKKFISEFRAKAEARDVEALKLWSEIVNESFHIHEVQLLPSGGVCSDVKLPGCQEESVCR